MEYIEDGAEFSSKETALLVQGASADQIPKETVTKLEAHDLLNWIDVIPRNLKILFEGRGGGYG